MITTLLFLILGCSHAEGTAVNKKSSYQRAQEAETRIFKIAAEVDNYKETPTMTEIREIEDNFNASVRAFKSAGGDMQILERKIDQVETKIQKLKDAAEDKIPLVPFYTEGSYGAPEKSKGSR